MGPQVWPRDRETVVQTPVVAWPESGTLVKQIFGWEVNGAACGAPWISKAGWLIAASQRNGTSEQQWLFSNGNVKMPGCINRD
jgi:hypothetical protein